VTNNTRSLGEWGEGQAAVFLEAKGFAISERNFRLRQGEIDIIARDPTGAVVFIEVKSAFGTSAGDPAFWVTPKKQHQLYRIAEMYLAKKGIVDAACRFDVVTVMKGKDQSVQVMHYEHAFIPNR
jgi:putative endonuclease